MNFLEFEGPIAFAVLVIIAGGVAAYYVIRMMKGKLVIELAKTGFNSGEQITGKVTLTVRKEIELHCLSVALIGNRLTKRTDDDGDEMTHKDEIYRKELNLEEAQTLPGGHEKTYEFTFVAPGNNSLFDDLAANDGTGGAMTDAMRTVNRTLDSVSSFGFNRPRLEWKLEARADLPGVDLAKKKKVRVNMM